MFNVVLNHFRKIVLCLFATPFTVRFQDKRSGKFENGFLNEVHFWLPTLVYDFCLRAANFSFQISFEKSFIAPCLVLVSTLMKCLKRSASFENKHNKTTETTRWTRRVCTTFEGSSVSKRSLFNTIRSCISCIWYQTSCGEYKVLTRNWITRAMFSRRRFSMLKCVQSISTWRVFIAPENFLPEL